MLVLGRLTLEQLADLTLDQLGNMPIDGFDNLLVVVPAGQVAEDINGFLLTVALPASTSEAAAYDSQDNRLDSELRDPQRMVVQVDLKAEEDNVIRIEGVS